MCSALSFDGDFINVNMISRCSRRWEIVEKLRIGSKKSGTDEVRFR